MTLFIVFVFFLSTVAVNGQLMNQVFQLSSRILTPQGNSGGCLTASANTDGAPATIEGCLNNTIGQGLVVPSGSHTITTFAGEKCLDVTNGVNANGVKLQFWTCGLGNPNQQWTFTSSLTVQWIGTNKCLDVTNGNISSGNQLQIWECTPNDVNQVWTTLATVPPPFGLPTNISFGPQNGALPRLCIAAESSFNGSPVALVPCDTFQKSFPSADITFTIPEDFQSPGPIATFAGTKCITVPNGDTTNGNKLQISDCVDGNTNQLFVVGVPGTVDSITWFGKNKCFDLTDGNDGEGTPIQIWDCIAGNTNQRWTISQ